MKRTLFVITILSFISFGMFADDATISMVNQGEKFYHASCLIARDLGITTVGGEYDENGALKPECDPKKVLPREAIKAAKWAAKKIVKTLTEIGERKVKEELESSKKK